MLHQGVYLMPIFTVKNVKILHPKNPKAIGVMLSLKNKLINVAISTAMILLKEPIKAAPTPAI